ncbi:MAG: hypothetical protein A3C43_00610 [Candidatus Schekmanbacteria bacterium RIFCSPHIGHO2_02_FULL_38_11]|uniref:DUF2231 domain-containing protein n=1 Tax=Candidatus Schekmanbacteria bacterium RIFCSPLOWO2_12_FULL_38_15 TaxID=1817883 RepID=A0A1F7SQ10_9BACT|nr:MAG: hypothetical protein A2043_03770 [Candidatus Schekmanbacteria bacterium GWA2_38_9]OGL48416.1 MAG: hypothetical protein A3H37_05445 [Candidatus Schekmanbacteria bacterium RIFCSPLOWO2_02_FULL_38_14]OGL52010.1 MAG: hypothetical protein A3C43_00610 [Candidatus Schekmanbacteria bacterium RIFCSPHIGHO2_02_FULL_38_11]OGL55298.1 MAG: hypothetical protein A3G31_04645 [Candidatus Schekmanbacteria bacterium RIFCSPLOWO2_12_FULL_38_15]
MSFDSIPIHPMMVHFTIALLSVGFLCDLLARFTKSESLKNAAWWNLLFGFFAIIATALTGWLAARSIPHSEATHEIMEIHEILGFTALGIFAVLLLWRILIRANIITRFFILSTAVWLIGVGVIFAGGYYGGKLVYEFGVGVKGVVQEKETEHKHNGTEHKDVKKETKEKESKPEQKHVHKNGKEDTH